MSEAVAPSHLQKWPIMAVWSGAMPTSRPLTGEQIRRAREAQRLTQQQLAAELGVGLRTIGRWERDEAVPRSAIGALIRVLRLDEPSEPDRADDNPPLRDASHAELLAELARRIEHTERRAGHELPDVPTGRYRFPKTRGPSARSQHRDGQDEPSGERTM